MVLQKNKHRQEMKLDTFIKSKKLSKNTYLILPVDFSRIQVTNKHTYMHTIRRT